MGLQRLPQLVGNVAGGQAARRIAAVLMLIAVPAEVWAQGAFGILTGIVRDNTGAVIPGVAVRVNNEETGAAVSLETQANGAYRSPQLMPGIYSLSVEQAGFKRMDVKGIKIDVGSVRTQDLQLQLGVLTESVRVEAQLSSVETATSETGTTVAINHVQEMALADRNVYRLVNLTPGAYTSTGVVAGAGTTVHVGGSRSWSVANTVDGVNNTRGGIGLGNIEMSPPVDSMQEFKVQLTGYSAEYGRSANGQITAVTRSGTNTFRGTLYEFLRNDKFDAAGWGNDQKPPLRRNNFGGALGGPVVKNRTFFFFNLDMLRQRQGSTITRDVGLPEWKSGDFSTATRQAGTAAAVVPIYDPETGTGTFAGPQGNTPFPGNRIPTSRLDPVAVKAVAFLPNANRAPNNPLNNTGNWQLNRVATFSRNYFTSRVDHQVTDSTRLFFRYIIATPDQDVTPALEGWGDGDPNAQSIPDRHQNAALNVTHLFSPTFFLNATVGFNRSRPTTSAGTGSGVNYAQAFGIPNAPNEGFPAMNYGGGLVPVTTLGYARLRRVSSFTNTDIMVNLTKIAGNHTLKFGALHTRFQGNAGTVSSAGNWGFNGRFTQGYTTTSGGIANTGITFADFLLGRLNSVATEATPTTGKRIQHYAGYVQEDWRATPKLTLNFGVRYEIETPVYEVNGRYAGFDPWSPSPLAGTGDIPAGALGVTTFQNRNGNGKYLVGWDKNNVAPRLGFAYRLTGAGDMVIRGGAGIYYGNPSPGALVELGWGPFGTVYSASHPVAYRMRDGLPATAQALAPESEFTPSYGQRGTRFAQADPPDFMDPNRVTNYSQNFNLNIERQWKGMLFEVGYVGNLSRQVVFGSLNINRIRPELLSNTAMPERLRRPWMVYNSDQSQVIVRNVNGGNSNYHAFLFKTERRFRGGFGWLLSYTHVRWFDDTGFASAAGSTDNDAIQNIYNRKGERALSTGSIPHRLVAAPIVELPFGKGRRWLNHGGVANALFGGWEVSTLATLQSGTPFGLTVLNGGRLYLGDAANGVVLRPDVVRSPQLDSSVRGAPSGSVRGIQWFDAGAFAVPAQYTFGNSSRTVPGLYGPGLVNFDTMLGKSFRIRETWRLQFRWETLNTFNTPAWGAPSTDVGAAALGNVTSAGGRRIMQFGIKVYY